MIVHRGDGGWWCVWPNAFDGPAVRVRFAPREDGRLEVGELHMVADRPLRADDLRRVPLAAIEGFANAWRDEIRANIVTGGRATQEATEEWLVTIDGGSKAGEFDMSKLLGRQPRPNLKLRVPEGTGKRPDSFYRRVADRYSALVELGSHKPAAEIAKANSPVPVSTVHRWIREARRRGFLTEAASQGKVG